MIRASTAAILSGVILTACGQGGDTPSTPEPAGPEAATASQPEAVAPGAVDAAAETETDAIQTEGYPDGWEMQNYWSGEYPNAFAVTAEGVTVMGHETITFEVYPPIYCGLPNKATYSPWNGARIESDDLNFVAMTYPTTFTIQEDATIEVFVDEGASQLDLKTGDVLTYKSYLAEGFFIAEKDGKLYEMNESELPQSTQFEQGPDDQEWVQVTCDDAAQTRAWVLYTDALNANGVEPYEYTGFGEASDLP